MTVSQESLQSTVSTAPVSFASLASVDASVASVAPAAPVSGGSLLPGSPFAVLGLSLPLVRALMDEKYSVPTPVQIRAIPPALDGRDLLARAQTGTGKTAAFLLPMLQRLAAMPRVDQHAQHVQTNSRERVGFGPRALILSPTRELAAQIGERAGAYARYIGVRHTVIYGGVSQRAQEAELRKNPDIVIATPGRLLDLLQQRAVSLAQVDMLVLDEADRMLDMGFIRDVRRLLTAMTRRRQTLFFSATLPPDIRKLAGEMLKTPTLVDVTPETTAAPSVTHAVWHVPNDGKRRLIEQVLLRDGTRRAIVFTRTKRGANRVCEHLSAAGFSAAAIHGNKSQNARDRALDGFREGSTRVLVATDIAARGIDVEDVGLVVNYDLPVDAESYVHRVGRAGRAGNTGAAVSFCDASERSYLAGIERLLQTRIPVAVGTDLPDVPVRSSASDFANSGSSERSSNGDRHRPGRSHGNGNGNGQSNGRSNGRSSGGHSSHRSGGSGHANPGVRNAPHANANASSGSNAANQSGSSSNAGAGAAQPNANRSRRPARAGTPSSTRRYV